MEYTSTTIRAFIGAKDYTYSREFYRALGFEELEIDATMCLIKVNDELSFYLQDYYVKDWIDNSMLLLTVDNLEACEKDLINRNLLEQFKGVRISGI
ncbi:MAG: glyoxalase [Pricia sp.]